MHHVPELQHDAARSVVHGRSLFCGMRCIPLQERDFRSTVIFSVAGNSGGRIRMCRSPLGICGLDEAVIGLGSRNRRCCKGRWDNDSHTQNGHSHGRKFFHGMKVEETKTKADGTRLQYLLRQKICSTLTMLSLSALTERVKQRFCRLAFAASHSVLLKMRSI